MRWKRTHIEVEESIITLLSEPQYRRTALESVRSTRGIITDYISPQPRFKRTHTPVDPQPSAPRLIKDMCAAADKTGVGPMAGVAGAVARECCRAVLRAGAQEAVVDNGGDIALKIKEPVHIGFYAGPSFRKELAFRVMPSDEIQGICTSSGVVGHSFSRGRAGGVTVFSNQVILADTAATSLGNMINNADDLQNALSSLSQFPAINGAVAACGGMVALWGEIPELVDCTLNPELITKSRAP